MIAHALLLISEPYHLHPIPHNAVFQVSICEECVLSLLFTIEEHPILLLNDRYRIVVVLNAEVGALYKRRLIVADLTLEISEPK